MRWPATLGSRFGVHLVLLLPLALLCLDLLQGHLGADPIRAIQLRTGKYALVLLILSLSCTPIYRVTGFGPLLLVRRAFGLYAFLYAGLRFLNFFGLDYRFDLALIWEDALEKRFALAGMAAFLLLAPLAVTSTAIVRRRLGRTWRLLHRLVYASALLAAAHFLWQAKADIREPLFFGAVVVFLLALRLPPVAANLRRARLL